MRSNKFAPSKKIITRRPNGSKRVVSVVSGVSRTDQSFAAEADINNIMKNYGRTGQLPVKRNPGIYGDLTSLSDLSTAMETVQHASELFEQIPAATRALFQNDPRNLIPWLQDPNNSEKAIELGLKKPEKKSSTIPTETITPGTTSTSSGNKAKGRVSGDNKKQKELSGNDDDAT